MTGDSLTSAGRLLPARSLGTNNVTLAEIRPIGRRWAVLGGPGEVHPHRRVGVAWQGVPAAARHSAGTRLPVRLGALGCARRDHRRRLPGASSHGVRRARRASSRNRVVGRDPSLALYALVGSSRQLSVGPESTCAIMTAAVVAPMAAGDPTRYAALAAALAVVVGILAVVGWVLRFGATRRLPHPPLRRIDDLVCRSKRAIRVHAQMLPSRLLPTEGRQQLPAATDQPRPQGRVFDHPAHPRGQRFRIAGPG